MKKTEIIEKLKKEMIRYWKYYKKYQNENNERMEKLYFGSFLGMETAFNLIKKLEEK